MSSSMPVAQKQAVGDSEAPEDFFFFNYRSLSPTTWSIWGGVDQHILIFSEVLKLILAF